MSTLRTINVVHPSGTTTNIVNDNAGNVAIGNGLTTVGNVGVGTSSPSNRLTISDTGSGLNRDLAIRNGDATNYHQLAIGYNAGALNTGVPQYSLFMLAEKGGGYGTVGGLSLGTVGAAPTIFINNGAETMRIDTSGNLLVGTTSYSSVADGTEISPTSGIQITSNGGFNVSLNKSASPAQTAFQVFNVNNTLVGYINYNGSGVVYNTTSDYRLKDEVQQLSGSLAKVLAIKPVSYVWKPTGIVDEGFIAHELQSVIPRAVDGEKDKIDEDGKPLYQGVDYSKIVVHLVAAIQELEARLAALEAK